MNCPVCGKPGAKRYRPFCSRHCADVDLGHWLRGDYAVPSRDPEDAERAAEALEEEAGKEPRERH